MQKTYKTSHVSIYIKSDIRRANTPTQNELKEYLFKRNIRGKDTLLTL